MVLPIQTSVFFSVSAEGPEKFSPFGRKSNFRKALKNFNSTCVAVLIFCHLCVVRARAARKNRIPKFCTVFLYSEMNRNRNFTPGYCMTSKISEFSGGTEFFLDLQIFFGGAEGKEINFSLPLKVKIKTLAERPQREGERWRTVPGRAWPRCFLGIPRKT